MNNEEMLLDLIRRQNQLLSSNNKLLGDILKELQKQRFEREAKKIAEEMTIKVPPVFDDRRHPHKRR